MKNVISLWIDKIGVFNFRLIYSLIFSITVNGLANIDFGYFDGSRKSLREIVPYLIGYFFVGFFISKQLVRNDKDGIE